MALTFSMFTISSLLLIHTKCVISALIVFESFANWNIKNKLEQKKCIRSSHIHIAYHTECETYKLLEFIFAINKSYILFVLLLIHMKCGIKYMLISAPTMYKRSNIFVIETRLGFARANQAINISPCTMLPVLVCNCVYHIGNGEYREWALALPPAFISDQPNVNNKYDAYFVESALMPSRNSAQFQ